MAPRDWVGGMFCPWTILRPAAVAALQPPARLGLWLEVFRRFFHWDSAAVILLPITGVGMLHRTSTPHPRPPPPPP
ncbi:hypothetical protein ACPTGW_28710, partial [Pseudomonas aeruginosa]